MMSSNDLIMDKDGRPFADLVIAAQIASVLSRETGNEFSVTTLDGGGFGLLKLSRSASSKAQSPGTNESEFNARWFRPSWRSQLSKVFSITVGLIVFSFSDPILVLAQVDGLAILIGEALNMSAEDIFYPASMGVSLVGLFIATVAATRAMYFIYSHKYYIGPWGIEANTELISKDQRRIEYRHIRGVNLRQGIVERALGIGTLDIATSGAEESEVQFWGVSNPSKLLGILRERLRVMA